MVIKLVSFFIVILFMFISANLINMKQLVTVPENKDAKLWRTGRAIYKSRCTSCHNPDPDLIGTSGPKTRGASEEYLRDMFNNGKPGIKPKPQFKRLIPALREYLK